MWQGFKTDEPRGSMYGFLLYPFYFFIYTYFLASFIYLVAPGLSCSTRDLVL